MQPDNVPSNTGFVPVDALDNGLDRAAIDDKGQIQLPQDIRNRDDANPVPEADEQAEKGSKQSQRHVLSTVNEHRHQAAAKLKEKLHLTKKANNPNVEPDILAESGDESCSRLTHRPSEEKKHTIEDFTHHPIQSAKSKVSKHGNHEVAANIAAKEVPHGQEVEMVKAYDAVMDARTDEERERADQKLSELMKQRQNTFIRWTLDRHVTKVRRSPRGTIGRKQRTDFQTKDARQHIVTDWKAYFQHLMIYYTYKYGGQYIGYGSQPPDPSKKTIMPNIERLLVATTPFQELIMTTRRVYRWENRTETTKYLLIYLILWYLNLLLPGILAAIVFFVVERRVHGNTLDDLRDDIKHREDVHTLSLSLMEFIEKRGDEKWADEIVESVGPWLMIQLADLANLFERVRNFYEWTVPARTEASLGLLIVAILITAICPVWLLVKTLTLAMGITFFCLFPIASNFPDYRLLVSPALGALWNIPTHAEWAIKAIQAEGAHHKQQQGIAYSPAPMTLPVSAAPDHEEPQNFYTAHYADHSGCLAVGPSFVRFISDIGHKSAWSFRYEEIDRIHKADRIIAKSIAKLKPDSGKDLKLFLKDGKEYYLKDVHQRDQAFSQIIGFSSGEWQVVW